MYEGCWILPWGRPGTHTNPALRKETSDRQGEGEGLPTSGAVASGILDLGMSRPSCVHTHTCTHDSCTCTDPRVGEVVALGGIRGKVSIRECVTLGQSHTMNFPSS